MIYINLCESENSYFWQLMFIILLWNSLWWFKTRRAFSLTSVLEINNQARSKNFLKIKVRTFAYLMPHNIQTTRTTNSSQVHIYSKLCIHTRMNNDAFTSHGREMMVVRSSAHEFRTCSRFSSHTNRHEYARAWQHACTHDARLREEVGGFIFVAAAFKRITHSLSVDYRSHSKGHTPVSLYGRLLSGTTVKW